MYNQKMKKKKIITKREEHITFTYMSDFYETNDLLF